MVWAYSNVSGAYFRLFGAGDQTQFRNCFRVILIRGGVFSSYTYTIIENTEYKKSRQPLRILIFGALTDTLDKLIGYFQ